MRAGGRLGELRFDTDLDVAHAVVRYLELLKLAALIARPEGQAIADAPARRQRPDPPGGHGRAAGDLQLVRRSTSTCSTPSATRAAARRRSPRATSRRSSRSCPRRGDGVVLSASDIDTYRTCPLKYKFARVFRIPQEPTVHQRFGIVVHQVLERFHARDARLADAAGAARPARRGWRRAGSRDSEEERQLRGKAAAALERYYDALRVRGGRAAVVRAAVHVPARARTCCAAASTASTACRAASTS